MIKIDRKLIEAAENITGSNYEASGDIISTDGIELMIEELIDSFYQVVEKFEDYVKEVDENYRRINTDPYYEYGVNERDFI
jgi:hypothetical protein